LEWVADLIFEQMKGMEMYIDPNTGGMLFQILAVAFAALSGLVLFFSGKIRMFFARLRRRAREAASDQEEQASNQAVDNTSGE
jgi:hypothetical protein